MPHKKRVRKMMTSKGLKTLVERVVAISMGGRVNKTRRCRLRQRQGLMRCVAERLYDDECRKRH